MEMDVIRNIDQLFASSAEPVTEYFSPGRINLIGEHLDYNGGSVLPAAIQLGIRAWVRPNNQGQVRIYSEGLDGPFKFEPSSEASFDPQYSWANLARGVWKLLMQQGIEPPSLDLYLRSNLPKGSGLSSSACMNVLLSYVYLDYASQDWSLKDIAVLAQEVENKFIDVQCGIMDPYAVALGKEGYAVHLDCEKIQSQYVPVAQDNSQFLILDTKMPRTLAGSAFNQRREECELAAKALGLEYLGQVDRSQKSVDDILSVVSNETHKKRARHALNEMNRVQTSAEILAQNKMQEFGKILNASHLSLQQDYEVSSRELDWVVEFSRQHEACIGSRMTGAGFGGCAMALVEKAGENEFVEHVKNQYQKASGIQMEIHPVELSQGVQKIGIVKALAR